MKKKICASCGFENDSNKKFCVSCGKSLNAKKSETMFCPECGERLEEGSLFCASCGTKVTSSEEKDILESVEDDEKQEDVEDTMDDSSLDEDVLEETQEREESADFDSTEEDVDVEEEKIDFCPECGERLEKGTLFCVSCGAKIGALEDVKEKDDSSVEEKVVPKNSSKTEEESEKKRILIIVLVLLLIAVLASFYYFFFYKPSHDSKNPEVKNEEKLISVPNVIDKTGKEAISILQDLSFEVRIVEEENEDTKKVGLVFEQNPVKGKLKKNSEITIKIYVSKEKVEMVPVTGNTLEEAQEKLNNLGVTIKVVEQSSDTVEKGKVISQDVSEGDSVSKGGTVTIIVSTGKEESNKDKEEPKKDSDKDKKTPEPTSTPKPTQSEKTPEPTKNPTTKPKNWSNWTTSLSSNITNNKYDIETKTQYRSRNKEIKTSTSSSLSGWTRYDTKTEPIYSETKTVEVSSSNYNSFKRNANYQIISEEVINVDITYLYCQKGGNSSSSSQWIGYKKIGADKTCADGYSVISVNEAKQPGNTSMVGTYIKRKVSALNLSVLVSSATPSDWKITYKEKTGDKTTYYFYRYGSWGAWQDNSINSSDSVQVETRTMYRYKEK